MNIKILNPPLVLIFFYIFQIPLINEKKTLRRLQEETFGSATLHFSSIGTKNLVNVNVILKEKLSFYLKIGNNLTKISDSDLLVRTLNSSISNYNATIISYVFNKENEEIVIKFLEKAISLGGLFALSQADKIILEDLQMENVRTMEYMFLDCEFLTELEVSDLNTSNVISMYGLFYNCKTLTKLDVSGWDTSNVNNMRNMFYGCSALTKLNVTYWDTSNVENMGCLFRYCNNLTELNVTSWDTSKAEYTDCMFCECYSLTELDVSRWNTSSVTQMEYMFHSCSSLTKLDISKWDTKRAKNMYYMFCGCSGLTELDLSNWDTSRVEDMGYMFYGCFELNKLNVSGLDTSMTSNMDHMFWNCKKLTKLNISNWDTSKVTSMENMFYGCSYLSELDVSDWVTSSVTNMNNMFLDCYSITQLNISKWDTSSVTDMNSMFYNCQTLTQLDISNWDTSSVTNMNSMFYNCKSLTQLDLSCWNTSRVTDMYAMFMNCQSLKKLNIETFIQTQITNSDKLQYFLDNDSNLEYCYFSGNFAVNMSTYLYRNCSKFVSFKKCGSCDNNSNENFCEKTLIINSENDLSSSKSISMIFHYLEEEISITDKSERSCYWITGLENFTYFNKSIVDEYINNKCDNSCKSCGSDKKICYICNDGFYSLFNETSLNLKRCYNELTKNENFYLYNSTGYKECQSYKNQIIFNGNCLKIEEILIQEKLNYSYEELKTNILNDLLTNYTNSYYDYGIFIYQLINKNITFTIYNVGTENMNNSYIDKLKLDIFKIDLGNCYEKIIKKYNITGDLIYGQIDFLDTSNSINYFLYDPKTNTTINMDICENMEISISKNIEITDGIKNIINKANEQGYNIADINDPFYNDVCTPFSTVERTDITMKDRITDIYDKNFEEFINYDECKFEFFNLSENNATVKCKSKVKTNFLDDKKNSKLDLKKLLNNFKFCEVSNFYVIKCYKKFLSKNGQSNNYANYIYYIILAIMIILLIIYHFSGINYLDITLAKIITKRKINNTKIKKPSKKKLSERKQDIKSDCISNSNNIYFPSSKNQFSNTNPYQKEENLSNPPKITRSNIKKKSNKSTSYINRNKSNLNSDIILIKENKKSRKNLEDVKNVENNVNFPIEIFLKENENNKKVQKKIKVNRKMKKYFTDSKIENQSIEKKQKKEVRIINTKDISEIDLNQFDYNEALKYDKRIFIKLYLSYIRLKHPIFSLFYNNYNISTIKIILFVHSFATHLCTNGLFFQEGTIHKIYIDNGRFNFIYRLPLTLYSVIISAVISFLLKKLVLTQSCIIKYKKNAAKFKNRDESIKKAVSIIKCYKIKFIIFVVLMILTLVAFWFYIGCFCTVYHNTQFYLLKDSLIGFSLSMLYPIGYLLILCLFRIIALKKNCACLYLTIKIFA